MVKTEARRLTSIAAGIVLLLTLLAAVMVWRAASADGSSWHAPQASAKHLAFEGDWLDRLCGLKW